MSQSLRWASTGRYPECQRLPGAESRAPAGGKCAGGAFVLANRLTDMHLRAAVAVRRFGGRGRVQALRAVHEWGLRVVWLVHFGEDGSARWQVSLEVFSIQYTV